jgi:hypothetical protein
MTQIIGKNGASYEVDIAMSDYADADAKGMSLAQHLNNKFDTDGEHGTAYEQILASAGMYVKHDTQYGIKPPTMASILDGSSEINMGAITRNEGDARNGITGRMMFPSVILEIMNANLVEDNTSYTALFNRMVANTISVSSSRYDVPMIDVTAPRGAASAMAPISQNSEPKSMVSISLSEKSFRLPTYSIGLSITKEAQAATTLDLVSIALREQALGERIRIIDGGLTKMITGDVDLGISALTSKTAAQYDTVASPNSAATFTQRAWLQYLRADWKKLSIDWVMCSLDTYLAIEGRVGKPIWTGNEGTDGRLNSLIVAANTNIPGSMNFFIVDDAVLGGAGKIVGIDSKRAITRVINSSANYSAIEEFVLRKSTALRFDFSETYNRMLNSGEGWRVMTFA